MQKFARFFNFWSDSQKIDIIVYAVLCAADNKKLNC